MCWGVVSQEEQKKGEKITKSWSSHQHDYNSVFTATILEKCSWKCVFLVDKNNSIKYENDS